MADNETIVRGVKWGSILSIGHVTRAFRIAIWPPSKLVLCLLALVISVGAGVVLDQFFATTVGGRSYCDNMTVVYHAVVGQSATPVGVASEGAVWSGCVALLQGPVQGLLALLHLIAAYWSQAFWFALLNAIIGVAVWTFFGGAVCRIAAVQFARDERIGLGEAIRFACKRYTSLVASPIAMFIVICLMAIPVFLVGGLVLLIPFAGEIVVALLFFLALILGVVLSLLTLFGVSSLGLQMPAIGAEGRDAFDAISRGVNYVFTRPWKYILYSLFSLLYMCLTFVLVRLFAFLVLAIPYAFMKMWPWFGDPENGESKLARIWEEPTMGQLFAMPDSGGTEYVAAVMIGVLIFVLLGMMVAFIPSFILSSQTIIYFLLRRMIDFKDLDEVYVEGDESETGLTRLEKTEDQAIEPEPPAAAADAGAADEAT
jgi:hypothetical protein